MINDNEKDIHRADLAANIVYVVSVCVLIVAILVILVKGALDAFMYNREATPMDKITMWTVVLMTGLVVAMALAKRVLYLKILLLTVSEVRLSICPICKMAHARFITVPVFSNKLFAQYDCGTTVSSQYKVTGGGPARGNSVKYSISEVCKNLRSEDDTI